MSRADVYGIKKEFISSHYDDIVQMRKSMSARKVASIYGGIISIWDIYNVERSKKKKKKITKK